MKVFVSHSWASYSQYVELISILTNELPGMFEDFSMPQNSSISFQLAGDSSRRCEIELQENRLIQIDQLIRENEANTHKQLAELNSLVENKVRSFVEDSKAIENKLISVKSVVKRERCKVAEFERGAEWLKKTRKYLHGLKFRGVTI